MMIVLEVVVTNKALRTSHSFKIKIVLFEAIRTKSTLSL